MLQHRGPNKHSSQMSFCMRLNFSGSNIMTALACYDVCSKCYWDKILVVGQIMPFQSEHGAHDIKKLLTHAEENAYAWPSGCTGCKEVQSSHEQQKMTHVLSSRAYTSTISLTQRRLFQNEGRLFLQSKVVKLPVKTYRGTFAARHREWITARKQIILQQKDVCCSNEGPQRIDPKWRNEGACLL